MGENEHGRRNLRILAVLFAVSCAPLTFLDLEVASQLAGALSLPLAVALAALSGVSASAGTSALFPWRRVLIVSAVVIAVLGILTVGYAVRENTKDLDVALSGHVSAAGVPWTDGGVATLVFPESHRPPRRDNLTLVVSLRNVRDSGDCENTALLDFIPVLDGKEGQAISVAPRTEVTLPLGGAQTAAQVKVVVHYEPANAPCKVLMQIDEAVLHD